VTTDDDLGDHDRNCHQEQGGEIDHEEQGTTVFAHKIGKAPQVAQANSGSGESQHKRCAATPNAIIGAKCDAHVRILLHNARHEQEEAQTLRQYQLLGWEVKSLRMGKADISESYVLMKDGEAYLIGTTITPLETVSTHYVSDPTRTRKLLLHKKELGKILAATQQKGLACVCVSLYWKGHLVKAQLALARGKQSHDKRQTEKDKDWDRQKQRVVRDAVKQ
jgi:SsrA-binding protein